MNRCNRTSKLLDLARRAPGEIIDGSGDSGLVRRTWKKLGGVCLKRGRRSWQGAGGVVKREHKRRDRARSRTHAQRRKARRGWQD